MIRLDIKKVCDEIETELSEKIKKHVIQNVGHFKPMIGIIFAGNDENSKEIVRKKIDIYKKCGIDVDLRRFNDDVSESEICDYIEYFNGYSDTDGFIVQFPLPKNVSEKFILEFISPRRDVEGIHPNNIFDTCKGESLFIPVIPFAVVELIHRNHLDLKGKKCVVVGSSVKDIIPLSMMLLKEDAIVTICNYQDGKLKDACQNADLVVSIGNEPKLISMSMIRDDVVLIDDHEMEELPIYMTVWNLMNSLKEQNYD